MAKKPTPKPKGNGIGAATGAQLGMQGTNTQTPTINKNFGANLRGVGGSVWKPTTVLRPPKKK